MTKSKGVGRGGARPGAGRKPAAPKLADTSLLQQILPDFATMTAEEIMERGMRVLASLGHWDAASKIGGRLETVRARKARPAAAPGKKAAAVETARTASAPGGKFATPPTPPGGQRPN